MDKVLGVGILEIPECEDEGEILLPNSSLIELKKQSAKMQLFSKWLNVINSGSKSAQFVVINELNSG